MSRQRFGSTSAVRHVLAKRSECAARTNHRVKQSTSGDTVAKLQAVRNDVLHPQVLRQWTHQVIESLADQYDFGAGLYQFLYRLNSFRLQARLQFVLEILFTQQVEAVSGYATQHGVDNPGGELPIHRVKNRP